MASTVYLITAGQFEDYQVLAVFSSRERAEAALPAYVTPQQPAEIEELPLDPDVAVPPDGLHAFVVNRYSYAPGRIDVCTGPASTLLLGPVLTQNKTRFECFARDRAHALQLAADHFAACDAQQAGIA